MPLRPKSLLFLLIAGGAALAQPPQTVSRQQHDERLVALQQVVRSCQADGKACSADRVGPDETVELSRQVTARVSYAWLRNALGDMAQKPAADRTSAGEALLRRLAAETDRQAMPADARKDADAVLRQVEFADAKPSWWDRQMARFERWWLSHFYFTGVSDSAVAWTRIALEIVLFAIPLTALGVWLMRQLKEDRLIPEHARSARDVESVSISWVKEAQACADRGEWREAIHALYWQTITIFEERRIWAVTRNRTPREYLALLQPGSEQRRLLREQTLLLETVWYGRRDATEADYQRAAALTRELAHA